MTRNASGTARTLTGRKPAMRVTTKISVPCNTATVAPPSVRPIMIARRGTGATRVSLRNPNWRSHSMAIPENIAVNSTVMPITPGAMNWRYLPSPARWNTGPRPNPSTPRYMSGPPSEATIWTRERRYFFTSRSQSTKMTAMRSSPPHAGDLTHLVRGRGALVPDGGAGERQERRFQRISAGLLLELRRRAGGYQAPVVDYGNAVGHTIRFVHVVGGEKHGDALGGPEIAHVGPHLIAALRIEAKRRLVEKQYLWRVQQPTGDLEAALHATGERLHQVVTPVPQLEHPQQDFTPLPPGVPRHVVQHPVDVHVLPCRELAVETRILEDDAEPLADCRLMRGDIESVELERARRRAQQGGEHLDRGGLAGAVRPQERENLPGADVEGDVVDGHDGAERFDDVLDPDDRTIAHLRPRRRRFGGIDELVVV